MNVTENSTKTDRAISKRLRRKRRLQRFRENEIAAKKPKLVQKTESKYAWLFEKRNFVIVFGTIGAFLFFTFATGNFPFEKQTAVVKFFSTYKKIYYNLVYDCEKPWIPNALLNRIHETSKILYQDEALKKFELALNTSERYTSIAFIGPPGVGKTLLALNVIKNYPWTRNAHIYTWHQHVKDNVKKMKALRIMAKDVFDCGINLLIIDNLIPIELNLLKDVEKAITDVVGVDENGELKVRIIVIYIFTLKTLLLPNEPTYKMQNESLQNLPNTTIINFKTFTNYELMECIRLESYLANIMLNLRQFHAIIKSIDVEKFGCKNVRAKVLMIAGRHPLMTKKY